MTDDQKPSERPPEKRADDAGPSRGWGAAPSRPGEDYTVIEIASIEQYTDSIEEYEGWLFRGQQHENWPIVSSIQRYSVRVPPLAAENTVLYEFQRRAHQYVPPASLPEPDELLDWLALMQHHGAPTRLTDWTLSPYVALFFALEDATDETGRCAVWGIDQAWLRSHLIDYFESNKDGLDKPLRALHARTLAVGIGQESVLFDRLVRKPAKPIVVLVDPFRQTDRVSLQQGVFLAPGDLDKSLLDNLRVFTGVDLKQFVVKFEVSNAVRAYALRRLREQMNITRASLFPGLDGYAQSLRHLIVDEDTAERQRRIVSRAIGWYMRPPPVRRGSISLAEMVRQIGKDDSGGGADQAVGEPLTPIDDPSGDVD